MSEAKDDLIARLKPVAWRVKDYADGWIFYTDEKRARIEAVIMSGALVEPLYSADALTSPASSAEIERDSWRRVSERLEGEKIAAEADAARMREARAMPSDETARAFIAAWREKYPGAGFPTLGDAKEMLAATFGVVNYSENNDLQEVVLSCRTLDDLKATQQTILAMRALTT